MTWRIGAYRAVRPLLFAIDPERIHRLTLAGMRIAGSFGAGRALLRFIAGGGSEEVPLQAMGLVFRNRIGLAAGFDKDGVALRGWAALGFGFVELGTVTPRPQPGNPPPRLFRRRAEGALVNRMGFNNAGADALAARIRAARDDLPAGFVVGVNIGRNRETPNERAIDDYLAAYASVAPVADYVAINVSSPNTPGLRDLQEPKVLRELLDRLAEAQPSRPLLVKLSPDLDPGAFGTLVETVAASHAAGLILSNTTVHHSGEPGGLSGPPLLPGMLSAVSRARDVEEGKRLALIASGGVTTPSEARAAIEAGAQLVQVWTGLVYSGPGIIGLLRST